MEFHVSRFSREKYGFEDSLFSYDGNVIFANLRAVRSFVQKINQVRAKEGVNEVIRPGEMNALGLIDEVMHVVIEEYRKKYNPNLKKEAYAWLQTNMTEKRLSETLEAFCQFFPPMDVVNGKMTVQEYLQTKNKKGEENRFEVIEEVLLLWVTNRNPAAMKLCGELFDERQLSETTDYNKLILNLSNYLKTQPKINGMTLIDYLRAPAIAHPDSLFDQLEYMRLNWSSFLGDLLRRLLLSLDLLREETKEHGFGGPGKVELPGFGSEGEYEAFSADSEWMPRLVLMAKNTYVWLDQISKKYNRKIAHLDEVPDEELQNLADEGFTGLWLIGLWERSKASATIKQYCGNPEAIASAYSLADYRIADDLGGESAFQELKRKAWSHGIRMASDMVPNHMGIDSGWVLYHPDRFLSLPYSPFPSYTFNGPNLSPDPHIGIFIEDHYYSRQDAAVVFQRVDYSTGDVRYIYHGNDGTTMPWNDTAQLNYLEASVREEVIQLILQVAHRFPIIRFDAAMTLAKKHYQRLWFPEPGSGGDIATRAEHGMTKDEFDHFFPKEFWREVVDRVAVEAPGTLLLAEAFWLMENYFVRTLGMHRVYNSAFMNLLRDEDNQRYRLLLKNTLEFDPEILKRYVNFMNNPDEKTAVEQFGKGDKYFGICVLMATMPGLPMFGHGQVVGFSEKYGMEYKKAYWDEQIDYNLLHRHEREIFPLLHERRRFAEAKDFVLYNFANGYGNVDENVYAYSNYGENSHNLVVYNNRYGDAEGFIRQSVPFVIKENGEKIQKEITLSEALGLHNDGEHFLVLHDHITGLNFVRPSWQVCREGLFFKLHAYQYYVFNEVYEVSDDNIGTWRRLCEWLNGNGIADVNEALEEVLLSHVLTPYRNCFDGHKLRWLQSKIGETFTPESWKEIINGTWNDFKYLSEAYKNFYNKDVDLSGLFSVYSSGIENMLLRADQQTVPMMKRYNELLKDVAEVTEKNPVLWAMILIGLQERLLVTYGETEKSLCQRVHLEEDWRLNKSQQRLLKDAGWYEITVNEQIEIIQWIYYTLDSIIEWTPSTIETDLNLLLEREDTQQILKANYYDGVCWFNKEMGDIFCDLLFMLGYYIDAFSETPIETKAERLSIMKQASDILKKRMTISEYHFERLYNEKEASKTKSPSTPTKEAKTPAAPKKKKADAKEQKAADSGKKKKNIVRKVKKSGSSK